MSAAPANVYDATSSMLGYLYQCRCALLLLLQRVKDDPDALLSIERFDDVAFEAAGEAVERIQTKHHLARRRNLTDASPDLWKTLRVWCDGIRAGTVSASTGLTLITTCAAPDGSAASYLRPEGRDEEVALSILRQIAATSDNQENAPAYTAFCRLDETQQGALIRTIAVLDRAPTIMTLARQLREELRWCVRPDCLDRLVERLEGWWCGVVIEHLTHTGSPAISGQQVQAIVYDLQEQFQSDNLTIDYLMSTPPEDFTADGVAPLFMRQLQWIQVSNARVGTAIRDFYRASKQRARWVREDPMVATELTEYDFRLHDEWQRHFEREAEEVGEDPCEDDCARCGRNLYNRIQDLNIHIRPRCTEPYVMRGSYHALADRGQVGWHLDYESRIRSLDTEKRSND